jgi:peptidoglycan/LPS O-acetylase OafA/YrhL
VTSGISPDPDSLLQWLAATPGSIALHESLHVYPWIETAHVLGIMLFVGTLALIDLRLLGLAFRPVPVSQMNGQILPWTVAGFVLMTATGMALFYAVPVQSFHSVWFRAKMLLILAAGINVFLFHTRVERDRDRWDRGETPRAARASAAISLVIWIGVIITGQMMAYNWFDCDRPQPPLIRILAGCPAELPGR